MSVHAPKEGIDYMGYEAFTDIFEDVDLRDALFAAQMFSYRLIMQKQDRNWPIAIEPSVGDEMYGNDYFSLLKQEFNKIDKDRVNRELQNKTDLYINSKSILCSIECNRMKRGKKESGKVMQHVLKMWKLGYYGKKDPEVLRALKRINKAYRETFWTIRTRLPEKLYNLIPDDLPITLKTKKYFVRSLYQKEENSGLYVLDESNIRYSTYDKKILQMTITPFIFRGL